MQAGFSLIEVMVAMGILSGMVIALSAAWVSLSKASLDLLLQQKAVFVLNGEMERLTALYQMTDFGHSGPKATSGYALVAGLPDDRYIYPNGVKNYMPSNDDEYIENTVTGFDAGADELVLRVSGATEAQNRDYVWLDRSRSLLGQLSWAQTDITPDSCSFSSCMCTDYKARDTNSSPCRTLTLIFSYPFRFDSVTGVETNDDIKTLSLQTIVGRRQ